jgi:cell division FtsZ-interacting protein ZapD
VSYQKHFAPVKSAIKENEKHEENLQVIKPLNGVDNSKFQPIIRRLDNIKVAITPYQMTPLHKVTNQVLQQMQSFNEYNE